MQWVVLEERRMDFKKFFKTETAELEDFAIIAASIPSHVSSRFTEVMGTLCSNSATELKTIAA
jgi:hypothetical protein